MKVRDIMSRRPGLINPSATVAAAAQKMRDDDLGCLLVGRDEQLSGIVTDRDIIVRTLADGRSAQRETVWNVMSSEVLFCFEDQPVDDAASIMRKHGIRRLPVLDRQNRLTGIVSLTDLHGGASREKPYTVTFYKEMVDGSGTLHEVPLSTVHVAAAVACPEDAVAAARLIFNKEWASDRWNAAADGCRVDRGP